MEARTSIKTAATRFTVLLAAVAAAMLAVAGPGSAKPTTPPPDNVSCAGTGSGGCMFTVSRNARGQRLVVAVGRRRLDLG